MGKVQGFALLYGCSSRAIRIVNGEEVGRVANYHCSTKKKSGMEKQVRKKYVMDENTQKRLDRLQDPLDVMSRYARAQKYESAKETEQYE